MERTRVRFSGRVQGVGFRATTQWLAQGHPVTGWVRNEPDGDVLMEVQGEPAAVNAFLAALRGRMEGFIHRETSDSCPAESQETGFHIRR